jgi:hypothetical protein
MRTHATWQELMLALETLDHVDRELDAAIYVQLHGDPAMNTPFSYQGMGVWSTACASAGVLAPEYTLVPHITCELIQHRMELIQHRMRQDDLANALQACILHAQSLERELDTHHGLGADAGSGYSVTICELENILNKVRDHEP